jgi:hypothetical protein
MIHLHLFHFSRPTFLQVVGDVLFDSERGRIQNTCFCAGALLFANYY